MIKKTNNHFKLLKILAVPVFSLIILSLSATHKASRHVPPPTDTIVIKHADRTSLKRINDSTSLIVLAGNVVMRQGKTIFKADSCIKNDRDNTFEAWRNVHINDSDTTDVYASHLKYLGQKQVAYLDGNVKLTDGQAVLTTPDLEYNMTTNIATYKNGGKVVNRKTVITSKEAYYYTDIKDVNFIKNVVVKDPAYNIVTDSLRYNTGNQIASFITRTVIKDSANRKIVTRDGFYNLKTGEAQFGQRPLIDDGNQSTIVADSVLLNDSIAKATGNAIIVDSTRGTTIIANLVFQNRRNEAVLATQKPLMIIKQDGDSIFITADTLFSAKLTDLSKKNYTAISDTIANRDSLKVNKVKLADNDSTNRYFEAFHNVRIYNDSVQAVSDSLFYSFKDSVFRLYKDPVVWGKSNQITGDTIYLFTENKKPKRFESINNSFLVNHLEKEAYNQIRSTRMNGYFVNGDLDSLRAKGSAESIYYLQDDDSAYTGINQSKSDIIDAYIRNRQLHKVVFRSQVTGTIYPIKQKRPEEMRLENFRWLESRRPKSKFELF